MPRANGGITHTTHRDPTEPYEVYYPMLHGNLHTTSFRGPQPVIEDIHVIWTTAFEAHLGIAPDEISNYKILIVVPDMYRRAVVQRYFDVALRLMGFCAAMCHVESVCTAFGAGLSSCCVVNVGDRCTAIACVDDGLSLPRTRLQLAYGGRDVQDALFRQLCKINFPYVPMVTSSLC